MDNGTGKHNWCRGDNCGIMGLAGGWHITCRSKADNLVGVCRILLQIVCRLLASWIMGQIRGVVTGGGAPARFKQGHLWSRIQTADFAQTVALDLVFNFYWLLLEGAFWVCKTVFCFIAIFVTLWMIPHMVILCSIVIVMTPSNWKVIPIASILRIFLVKAFQ